MYIVTTYRGFSIISDKVSFFVGYEVNDSFASLSEAKEAIDMECQH